jgi:hypothetical protein
MCRYLQNPSQLTKYNTSVGNITEGYTPILAVSLRLSQKQALSAVSQNFGYLMHIRIERGYSIVSQQFMEPEGLLPYSQELSTCSYPESENPVHITPIYPSKYYYLSTYVLVFLVVSFPLAFLPIIYTRSSSPH